ncbi:MAG: TRAP transporter substrate-binding protein DctP [Desulfarculaceae bacterium]|nr:TRAP transporter substrate-binding protein DctP [Desulfarculaceae bacterium]MCF8071674.1 TRAP transporter substrate-binding protein DctP [Desulfarculaceae bacterium]MCF8102479.1 TRAP transporter substrate-binding protein DctP [Desulfarculaceae bacterium]MCF8116821.1 TRAP transporter substrate-binding protein DctP [Desulfarculaceae bacterium]
MARKLLLLLACFSLLLATSGLAQAKTLKFQCVYPETAYVGQGTKFFADQVKKLTNGKLKIKVFWPGQLVKSREALEALKTGMIDGYSGSFLYFTGVFPEVNVQWLPFNWSGPEEAMDILRNQGYLNIFSEAMSKHGVTFLGSISVATMGLMTKFPVNGLADLQGKKIRAFGLEALIVQALGAAAAAIPGAEQYMALQRGTVDGTDYPWYTLKKYKLYEVLDYVSDPAFHTPGIVELVINSKVMASLPADQQEAVKKAAIMAMDRSFELSPTWDKEAIEFAKTKKVKIIKLSDAELLKWRQKLMPLYEQTAAKSPYCRKLVDILKANLKAKGVKF